MKNKPGNSIKFEKQELQIPRRNFLKKISGLTLGFGASISGLLSGNLKAEDKNNLENNTAENLEKNEDKIEKEEKISVNLDFFQNDILRLSSDKIATYEKDEKTLKSLKEKMSYYDSGAFKIENIDGLNFSLKADFERTLKILDVLSREGRKGVDFWAERDDEFVSIISINTLEEKKQKYEDLLKRKFDPVVDLALERKAKIEENYRKLFG